MSRDFEITRTFYPYNIYVEGDEIFIEQFDNTHSGTSLVAISALQADVFLHDIQMAFKAIKESKKDIN